LTRAPADAPILPALSDSWISRLAGTTIVGVHARALPLSN